MELGSSSIFPIEICLKVFRRLSVLIVEISFLPELLLGAAKVFLRDTAGDWPNLTGVGATPTLSPYPV